MPLQILVLVVVLPNIRPSHIRMLTTHHPSGLNQGKFSKATTVVISMLLT
jgi:hypothetical protein